MFVTNHGSGTAQDGSCVPTSSTYAGQWYSVLTLGTNLHCEHHDFPTIPFDKLHELRKIAPEFYDKGSDDNVMKIMDEAFAHPEFYACMDAGLLQGRRQES
jgi:fatty acid desaturase